MSIKKRALAGALSGLGGTFVLTGLRRALDKAGIIDTSAPEQVVSARKSSGSWKAGHRRPGKPLW